MSRFQNSYPTFAWTARVRRQKRAIHAYVDARNADPTPFQWTKSADHILASIERRYSWENVAERVIAAAQGRLDKLPTRIFFAPSDDPIREVQQVLVPTGMHSR